MTMATKWPFDVEALEVGAEIEYRFPNDAMWRPGTLVEKGGGGFWRVQTETGEVKALYIEYVRTPGGDDAFSNGGGS